MRPNRRFAPLLLVPIAVGALFALDVPSGTLWPALAGHEAMLRDLVAARPVGATVGYALVCALATALAFPESAVLAIFGGFLFGTTLGAALAVLGGTVGAVLLFLAIRTALAGAIARRAGRRLDRVKAGVERDGFSYLLALRFIPVMPFWLFTIAPALAGMRLRPFALATCIGIIPATTVLASIGAGLDAPLQPGKPPDPSVLLSAKILLPLAALALPSLLPVALRRWRRPGCNPTSRPSAGRFGDCLRHLGPHLLVNDDCVYEALVRERINGLESRPHLTTMTPPSSPPVGGRPVRSLSWRLLWLTVAIVLLTEVLVFIPGLARERRSWLWDHVNDAHIAALSVEAAPHRMVDAATRNELLRVAGARGITLRAPGRELLTLQADPPAVPHKTIDLRDEDMLTGMRRALYRLTHAGNRVMLILADTSSQPPATVELLIDERPLRTALLDYARNFLNIGLLIAGVSGLFVYLAVLMLLVRPVRRLTDSIVAFRADPERTVPLDPSRVAMLPDDELAIASEELAAMQHELRAALWRNARLTALGTAVAKVSHDLRNILSPAMLAAERLESHADPSVSRAGAVLTRAVDRATKLVGHALDFAREAPPPVSKAAVDLAPLMEEAAETMAASGHCWIDIRIGQSVEAEADRSQLLRVASNLLRNAAESGARRVEVRLADPQPDNAIALEIADDGPGLPPGVQAKLFRPFVESGKRGGTGLGLAIAADLMRAQGGDLALVSTGAAGTVFRLTLPGHPTPSPDRPNGFESNGNDDPVSRAAMATGQPS